VRYTDRQVGVVLDALEKEGLADSTMVVLWGDHGWFLGDGAQWGKHSPLETALHSPLSVRAPGVGEAGMKTEAVASTIDIYPTLMELCRPEFQKTEAKLDGQSLVGIMSEKEDGMKRVSVSTWNKATSYRSSNYRMIFNGSPNQPTHIELYEVGQPGGPWIDIADKQPKVVESFLDLLRKP